MAKTAADSKHGFDRTRNDSNPPRFSKSLVDGKALNLKAEGINGIAGDMYFTPQLSNRPSTSGAPGGTRQRIINMRERVKS